VAAGYLNTILHSFKKACSFVESFPPPKIGNNILHLCAFYIQVHMHISVRIVYIYIWLFCIMRARAYLNTIIYSFKDACSVVQVHAHPTHKIGKISYI